MRIAAFFVVPLALAFLADSLQGAEPELKSGVILQNGGSALWVDRHATPEAVDWENDGVMDLLVGNRNYDNSPEGYVRYFEAVGPLSLSGNELSASAGG